jgi:type VI secretion system FHA domain protein
MKLVLSLGGQGAAVASGGAPKVLDGTGMTIGRGAENDWVLPDPDRFLSKKHCVIEYQDGRYYLTDTSSNGVFLNHSAQRLERDHAIELHDGDVLTLGAYELSVRLEDEGLGDPGNPFGDLPEPYHPPAPAAGGRRRATNDPFGPMDDIVDSLEGPNSGLLDAGDPFDDPLAPGGGGRRDPLMDDPLAPDPLSSDPLASDPLSDPLSGSGGGGGRNLIPEDDDLIGPGLDPAEPEEPLGPTSDVDHSQQEQDFFAPPKVSGGLIPDDWDDDLSPDSGPAPAAQPAARAEVRPGPSRAAAASADMDTLASAFLEGAGIPDGELAADPEQMRKLGLLTRLLVEGLREILMTRSEIKNEFRIERTMVQAGNNNPLKFSPTVEAALKTLLDPPPGFQPADTAIREGFDDIRAHQLAVMAGMQVALKALLRRFDPENLAKHLESRSTMESLLSGGKKAQYWDAFTELFEEIAREAEDDFQSLFGREFSRAYEEQIRKLRR